MADKTGETNPVSSLAYQRSDGLWVAGSDAVGNTHPTTGNEITQSGTPIPEGYAKNMRKNRHNWNRAKAALSENRGETFEFTDESITIEGVNDARKMVSKAKEMREERDNLQNIENPTEEQKERIDDLISDIETIRENMSP